MLEVCCGGVVSNLGAAESEMKNSNSTALTYISFMHNTLTLEAR